MSIVVDFAWSKPSASQLKSWGAVAAGMYVSHDTTKNASAAIIRSYATAGIKSFLFFEDAASRATGGYAAGTADAEYAYSHAAAWGKPSWAPIVPAADFDIPDYAPNSTDPKEKLGPVGEYFRAWHDYNKAHRVIADAAYGDYYAIKRLTQAGLCQIGVQTIAWSGGQVDLSDIVLLQNAQMLDGGQVDIEIIEDAALLTHLAWVPGESSPVPAPPTTGTQNGWAWCRRCRGMFFGALTGQSRCPLGGHHDGTGSYDYGLAYGSLDSTATIQPRWRHCGKCQGLFYGPAAGSSRCPEGGQHVMQGLAYLLNHGATGPGRQAGWNCCNRCQGLFFGRQAGLSHCPAGGQHDATGSLAYVIGYSR